MTNKEILQGNKLVAEFMGYSFQKMSLRKYKTFMIKGYHDYNENWNALMLVVVKIESLGYCVCIFRGCCDIEERMNNQENWEEIASGGGQPKILSAYMSVIKFIKWYNAEIRNGQPIK